MSTPWNRIGFRHRLARLRGSTIALDLHAYDGALDSIDSLEARLQQMPDAEIPRTVRDLRDRREASSNAAGVRAEVFAVVRGAARRTLGMRAYDVQVLAALAMSGGNVVEMQTGEGKTLAAVMTAAWKVLAHGGVHVLTFNDYPARRDAEWMRPAYQRLGLTRCPRQP